MITEDYVSFETAKLLKEKGFPQEYNDYNAQVYNEEDYEDEYEVQRMVVEAQFVKAGTLSSYPISVPEPKCYCCTLQMAMKWLREVYSINFNISWNPTFKDYFVEIFKPTLLYSTITYQNYEEACEAAIKYCLENLINKKEGNT